MILVMTSYIGRRTSRIMNVIEHARQVRLGQREGRDFRGVGGLVPQPDSVTEFVAGNPASLVVKDVTAVPVRV